MKSRSVTKLAVLAATWLGPAAAASGQTLEERLQAQEERIRALEAEVRSLRAERPGATPVPVAAPAPAAPPAEISIKLRGRLQVDAQLMNDGDGPAATGTQVRRFYLGAEGRTGRFRYQAEADFAGNKVSLQDAFIAYEASPSTDIVAGYFKPAITSDDTTSDVLTLFLERSAYAGVFAPGRRVGVGVNHAGAGWGIRAGLFGEREDAALDGARQEGWVASARIHGDLMPGPDVFHLAAEAYHVEPSATDKVFSFSQRPEANRALVAVNTGTFEAENGNFGGGELGYASGPFTFQAEGGALRLDRGGENPVFWGGSAQLSWRWTGEARPYDAKAGVFGRVTPVDAFSGGGTGALETGVRLTHVDLSDGGIDGGRLTTYGIVLNWFPVSRVRASANFIHAAAKFDGKPDTEQNLLAIRGAIDW